MDDRALPPAFEEAARPAAPETAPPQVMVSLPIDADLLKYFQSDTEPADWQAHMNGVLRFYMETTRSMLQQPNLEPYDAEADFIPEFQP